MTEELLTVSDMVTLLKVARRTLYTIPWVRRLRFYPVGPHSPRWRKDAVLRQLDRLAKVA